MVKRPQRSCRESLCLLPWIVADELGWEVVLDTAAILLRDNALALLQLNSFSVALLGQSLPPSDQLLASILSDLSASGIPGLLGLELGLSIADSVQGTTP
jgi:hypothetical protein